MLKRCSDCLRYMEVRILFTTEEFYCPYCEQSGQTPSAPKEEVTEKLVIKCACFTDSMGAWNMCDACSNLNTLSNFQPDFNPPALHQQSDPPALKWWNGFLLHPIHYHDFGLCVGDANECSYCKEEQS